MSSVHIIFESLLFFQRRYASVAEERISIIKRFLDSLRKFMSIPQWISDSSFKH